MSRNSIKATLAVVILLGAAGCSTGKVAPTHERTPAAESATCAHLFGDSVSASAEADTELTEAELTRLPEKSRKGIASFIDHARNIFYKTGVKFLRSCRSIMSDERAVSSLDRVIASLDARIAEGESRGSIARKFNEELAREVKEDELLTCRRTVRLSGGRCKIVDPVSVEEGLGLNCKKL